MDETDQQYKVVRRYPEEVLTHEYEPRLHLDWIIACNIHHETLSPPVARAPSRTEAGY